MSHEAELPGRRFTAEAMQMIFTRYHTISQYVEGKTVLDVGCGAGIGLGYLVRKGAKSVVGIDYSTENLRIAKHHYNNRKIKIIQSDAHKMPFKDNYFDVITAMQVIQYLSIDRFLSECRRIFKREGVLILCLPNKDRAEGFQRSPLSKNYFSIPDLFSLLTKYHFDTKLLGAFPVPEKNRTEIKQESNVRKIINIIPKSVRERIGNIIDHKSFVLANEIEDGIIESAKLVPISHKHPDIHHKILYVIAYSRESSIAQYKK